eukprot:11445358-Alexandrium_andersonii.AAC.1
MFQEAAARNGLNINDIVKVAGLSAPPASQSSKAPSKPKPPPTPATTAEDEDSDLPPSPEDGD